MTEESKLEDPINTREAAEEVIAESKASNGQAEVEFQDEDEQEDGADTTSTAAAGAEKKKKKKSKKKRIKDALIGGDKSESSEKDKINKAVAGMSNDQAMELLKMNPALGQQLGVGAKSEEDVIAAVKKLDLVDIMTGLAAAGKNAKDMGAYKFWGTQPVKKFGDTTTIEEGPFKMIDLEQVSKEPGPMVEGFEWVTMDLTNSAEIKEVYELLNGHYVEDSEAMFRFDYSEPFLKWALQSPGWMKDWHVGVRATTSRKLVAFISAVPMKLRVRKKILHASEVNFLCIHKKLRSKRLAPVLIKEITRRCYLKGTWQALYTAGVVLPTPVSTCRYYHRSLDWAKLHDIGFSPLPYGSKPQYQVAKYKLPDRTTTEGLRPMETRDLDAVTDLLKRYLDRFDMAPQYDKDEISHLMLHKGDGEQVTWTYVVENPNTNKITDFFSYYLIESTVVNPIQHTKIRAAYLFYYATEAAFNPQFPLSSTSVKKPEELRKRLNLLMNDALILAKKAKFDVLNALTLYDNNLFLEEQKFGGGDGQLHFYLYNYNANPIAGGVDKNNHIDEHGSGIGVVML
ncbi:acyl-CoA N-acyltransferase [Calycina marina]|uniref:Glycylpeptide N-tetradecanoyltransferase n=1 Tax=Calycina marina TaxID=1763456 RepID=A0A9P8CCF8_9HELO|nr:acyl-CoA N-acyltransferase [Calycina marina]